MIENISLNQSLEGVKVALGSPLKESDVNGFHILRYNSNTQRLANFLYFQEGKLVQISESIYQRKQTLFSIVDQLSTPELSIKKYATPDRLDTTVHLWSSQGIGIVSYGIFPESIVERKFTFSPQSTEIYLQTLGQAFAQNEVVTIAFTKSEPKEKTEVVVMSTPSLSSRINSNNQNIHFVTIGLIASIILVVLGGVIQTYLWRKRKQKKTQLDNFMEH